MEFRIKINANDVTRDLAPYVLSVMMEENLSGEADTAEINLADYKRLFMGEWFPPLGATLETEIRDESNQIKSGLFEIDEVTCSYAPSEFRIKAVSVSQNSALRQHDESKSWEGVRLSRIAADIASESGVELFYEATDDPLINRAEQSEMSRLAFLEKICADNYLIVKVSDGQLIIYDESKLDAQPAVKTFRRDKSAILRFSARATLQEIYKAAQVTYKHGRQAELFQGRFDSGKEKGKILKLNKKADSQAEAEKMAKNELRRKNKEEIKITMETAGDFALSAGNVIELAEHGVFSGNYVIEKIRHELNSSGSETRMELRKCLEGY